MSMSCKLGTHTNPNKFSEQSKPKKLEGKAYTPAVVPKKDGNRAERRAWKKKYDKKQK